MSCLGMGRGRSPRPPTQQVHCMEEHGWAVRGGVGWCVSCFTAQRLWATIFSGHTAACSVWLLGADSHYMRGCALQPAHLHNASARPAFLM